MVSILTFSLFSCAIQTKEESFNKQKAFAEIKHIIHKEYAYLDKPDFDVGALFSEYESRLENVKNDDDFIDLMQQLVRNFHDPHLNVGPYNLEDFSVLPTGSDVWAKATEGKFVIIDVRGGAAADKAKVRVGNEIIKIDGKSVEGAIFDVLGKDIKELSDHQIEYALNVSLSGKRYQPREWVIKAAGKEKKVNLPASYDYSNILREGSTIVSKKVGEVGYIRFNNSLGNSKTVDEFREAITQLLSTKGLIIDLRNTPSGGNTGVAEPILGHFVGSETAYQLYRVQKSDQVYNEASLQTAYARPSSPYYNKPVVVLVGRWTGSMGEGMAIGLDALGAKSIVGSPMADLLGGIKTSQLENSKSRIEFGFERLYHVNGSFREDFVPDTLLIPADSDSEGNDPALTEALSLF